MRQVIYSSITTAASGRAADDIPEILRIAVERNAAEGISGLLYTEDGCFLQAIEGPDAQIADLVERLRADSRHRDIAIFINRTIEAREFGGWTMVYRDRHEPADAFDGRVRSLLGAVSPATASYFLALG